MLYKLTVRGIKEEDFDKDCNFPDTDKQLLELNLDELVNHIQEMSFVSKVTRDSCILEIVTANEIEKKQLLGSMKAFFSQMWCDFRFVSLDIL